MVGISVRYFSNSISRVWFCVIAAGLGIVIPITATATDLTDYASVYSVKLTDSDGWDYGLNYYASNSYNGRNCVYTQVKSIENLDGSINPGPILLNRGETGVLIGSFKAHNYGQAWNVHVQYQADDNCY